MAACSIIPYQDFTAPCTLDSASIRKLALLTTRSPPQTAFYRIIIAVFSPQFDKSRLHRLLPCHKNHVSFARRQHGADGDATPSPWLCSSAMFTLHVGTQFKIRILNLHPHAHGAAGVVQEGINEAILPVTSRRDTVRRDGHGHVFFEERQFVLVKLRPDPDHGKIDDINQMMPMETRRPCHQQVCTTPLNGEYNVSVSFASRLCSSPAIWSGVIFHWARRRFADS